MAVRSIERQPGAETAFMSQPITLSGKMAHLKTLLVNAENFSEPMNYFFDVLTADPGFVAKGKPLKDKNIEMRFRGIVEILHQRMAPGLEIQPQRPLLLWLKQFEFAHGSFAVANRLGVAFYFRDLDSGLCALAPIDGSTEVVFSRFSVYENTDPSKSFHIDRSGRRH
jgi:hypothetical protein